MLFSLDEFLHDCSGSDLPAPVGAEVDLLDRAGQAIAAVSCPGTDLYWELYCIGNEWVGEVGECDAPTGIVI